jgi:hypothetical protein
MEAQEPEAELEIEQDGTTVRITGTVRCALACAECGTELKETTFDVDEEIGDPRLERTGDLDPKRYHGMSCEGHPLEIEVSGEEATESGGSRYAKNMRGFRLHYHVTCVENCPVDIEGDIEDSLQASAWDELT